LPGRLACCSVRHSEAWAAAAHHPRMPRARPRSCTRELPKPDDASLLPLRCAGKEGDSKLFGSQAELRAGVQLEEPARADISLEAPPIHVVNRRRCTGWRGRTRNRTRIELRVAEVRGVTDG